MKLVLTCEHAGNRIPDAYKYLFDKSKAVLETHRGYDPGAYDLFRHLIKLSSYHRSHEVSRLLVEVNRSLHHPSLFSEFTSKVSPEIKQKFIKEYYQPYRTEVEKAISEIIATGEEVIHLSVHSFTPALNGKTRNADIGLLYDPARSKEKDFCKALKRELQANNKSLKVRYNYPYMGTADGFTTGLRKIFTEKYLGIEIEVNQKLAGKNRMDNEVKNQMYYSLKALI